MSDSAFEITVDIPPSSSGLQAQMNIKPVLDIPSKIVEVRYKLPFGLDVAPKEGFAVCTKDGPGGGWWAGEHATTVNTTYIPQTFVSQLQR